MKQKYEFQFELQEDGTVLNAKVYFLPYNGMLMTDSSGNNLIAVSGGESHQLQEGNHFHVRGRKPASVRAKFYKLFKKWDEEYAEYQRSHVEGEIL